MRERERCRSERGRSDRERERSDGEGDIGQNEGVARWLELTMHRSNEKFLGLWPLAADNKVRWL